MFTHARLEKLDTAHKTTTSTFRAEISVIILIIIIIIIVINT